MTQNTQPNAEDVALHLIALLELTSEALDMLKNTKYYRHDIKQVVNKLLPMIDVGTKEFYQKTDEESHQLLFHIERETIKVLPSPEIHSLNF